ncbi:hypothetical protein HZ326_22864 [Fusarium oxysporum f. sp. albedinis]|nr:hypothetical protein HZ326_22864 [Fusarium oxysporum f. sp. albedinis]
MSRGHKQEWLYVLVSVEYGVISYMSVTPFWLWPFLTAIFLIPVLCFIFICVFFSYNSSMFLALMNLRTRFQFVLLLYLSFYIYEIPQFSSHRLQFLIVTALCPLVCAVGPSSYPVEMAVQSQATQTPGTAILSRIMGYAIVPSGYPAACFLKLGSAKALRNAAVVSQTAMLTKTLGSGPTAR